MHEALHLQLSLVERVLPMVVSNPGGESEQVFSPWAGDGRSVRGLLHGVYVFGIFAASGRGHVNRFPPYQGSPAIGLT